MLYCFLLQKAVCHIFWLCNMKQNLLLGSEFRNSLLDLLPNSALLTLMQLRWLLSSLVCLSKFRERCAVIFWVILIRKSSRNTFISSFRRSQTSLILTLPSGRFSGSFSLTRSTLTKCSTVWISPTPAVRFLRYS